MCTYHMPTYSFFYVRISASSTVSGFANGFPNPVVSWNFFQAWVLKPKPKMYLNTSIPLDSRHLPYPPRQSCHCFFEWLKHFRDWETAIEGKMSTEGKDITKTQIMRCQTGQTVIVNCIYSAAFGIQPWCFQKYKVVSSTCSRLSLLNEPER